MKTFRVFLWVGVVIAAAVATWFAMGRGTQLTVTKLGTEFNLLKADGSPISHKDLLGKPHLMFFGFTHCPEVCPTTLYEASGWLQALGSKSEDLRVYFVSVDPERDTPELLENYLSPFDKRIDGITGNLEEIDRLAKSFHVYYRKVPLDEGGYTIDHTASVFMMKPDGSFHGTIAWGEDPDIALKKLERLLKS